MGKYYWNVFGLLSTIIVSVQGDKISPFPYPQEFERSKKDIPAENVIGYGRHFSFSLERNPIQAKEMLYIAFSGSNFRVDGLDIFGTRATELPTNVKCYYFAPANQTDTNCQLKAKEDKCAYIRTQTLFMIYKSADDPKFGIHYIYAKCSDRGSSERTSITNPSVNTPVIERKKKTPKQESTTNTAPNSEGATTHHNDPQRDQTTLIAAVAVAAVLFVIIVLVLLFCGIRFSRNREHSKAAHLQKSSKPQSSIAPSPEALYEEILPELPSRNPNMQDPGYEIPIRTNQNGANGGAAMHTNNNPAYVTIQNELYHGINGDVNKNNESLDLDNESHCDESEAGSQHSDEDNENSCASEVVNVLYHA